MIVAMRNWLVCAACLWFVLGHLSAVEAGQQVEPASGSVRPPVPIKLAAERAVKELVARQVKLLESSPLSLTPGAVPQTLKVLTNVAGFLLKIRAGMGGGGWLTGEPPSPSALERYRLHRLDGYRLHRLDAPPQN